MPSERDYAERLREQAYKTLSPQVKGLESELKAFSDALSAGIYQIERKLEAINRVELPTTKAVLDEILQDVLRRKDQQDRSLALFARELRAGETQEEILGLLLDHACNFFSRAALFAVRNDRFVGWSSRGYSPETARSIAGCSIPLSECPRFREALESGDVQPAPDLYADSSLSFLQAESEETAYLVSLHVMQRPVAVLLAQGAAAARCDALSFLAILTEMRLENVALKILYALTEGTPAAGTPPLPAVELKEQPVEPAIPAGAELVEEKEPESAMEAEPEVEVEPAEEAAEPAISAEAELVEEKGPEPAMEAEPEVEVEPAEEAAEPAIPAEAALVEEKEPEPIIEAEPEEEAHPETPDVVEPVEVAAETAIPDESKEFEAALGALSAAGPEEAQEKEPAAPPKAAGTAEAASEAEPREARPEGDEEKLHADAKRFARLLVSEIKLYNETAVSEGRENNDLYIRLKRDIDKSREMYDKRVSPAVSQKMDYFHDEIVRILGGNDPSKLGSDYPGGRI